jgi:CheY-like chemotaxis protein
MVSEHIRPHSTGRETVNMKVLVVEDDADNGEMLVAMLERRGCMVVHAADGADAISAMGQSIKTGQFDLLIVDVAMMWVDGFAFVKAVRCFEHNELYPKPTHVKFHTAKAEAFDNPHLLQHLEVSLEDCYLKGRDTEKLLTDVEAMC